MCEPRTGNCSLSASARIQVDSDGHRDTKQRSSVAPGYEYWTALQYGPTLAVRVDCSVAVQALAVVLNPKVSSACRATARAELEHITTNTCSVSRAASQSGMPVDVQMRWDASRSRWQFDL